ncbi:MAG: nucleotidyl transferase AbiEii/AbiGii toxin family protein [Calditrichaeota bacterium]|nr:nucleotidyl transferase AbiEii/AbiGii toxin family protein [Calditrichota bacterium]
MKDTLFYRQANLLLDILPLITTDEERFALKGGTAINFFIRNLPRLSVDIDLTYLPTEDRRTTLQNIDRALKELGKRIEKRFPAIGIVAKKIENNRFTIGLIVRYKNASVKIEPNLVVRGSVYPPKKRILAPKAQEVFEKAVQVQTLSFADLYAGKICAALDRQHPRDLFDIKLLLENEGLSEETRLAFIVYLVSHNRPMAELLNPNKINIASIFDSEFKGMTYEPVALEELIETRDKLIEGIKRILTKNDKEFLISVKSGEPDWKKFPIDHIKELPAVQWKLQNIRRMDKIKRREALKKLIEYLDVI